MDCVNDGLAESQFVDKCYCGKYNVFGNPYCPAPYTDCAWVGQQFSSPYSQESYNYDGVTCDALVNITQGVTCESAAASCFQLPDLKIGTCTGGPATNGNPCLGPTAKRLGDPCNQTPECCATNGQELECSDGLCVSNSDK